MSKTNPASIKKNFAAVDCFKYISAMLAIAVYTLPFVQVSETFNLFFIDTICRLALPFAMTITSYFFFCSQRKSPDKAYGLYRFISKLIRLYLIWTVIYLPYTIWNYSATGFTWQSVIGWLRDFFLNGSYYHLWFFPAVILGMLIVWNLYENNGFRTVFFVSFFLYLIGYAINIYGSLSTPIPVLNDVYGIFFKVFATPRNGLFFAPIYLVLGLAMAKFHTMNRKISRTLFILSFVLLIGEALIYWKNGLLTDLSSMFLSLPLCVYSLCCWLINQRKIKWKPSYRKLRREAFLIYCLSILSAKPLFLALPGANLVVYFLTLAISQFLASMILFLTGYFPILRKLYR